MSQKKYKIGDIIKLKSSFIINDNYQNLYKTKAIKRNGEKESIIITTTELNILESGFLYKINSYDSNKVKIEPLDFKIFSQNKIKKRNKKFGFIENGKIDKSIRGTLYNDKIFSIPKEKFDSIAEYSLQQKSDLFTIGLLTLPFKFRTQGEKSFTTNFNLNSTLNYRFYTYNQTNIYIQLGAGLGSVSLNPTNAEGIEKGQSQNVETLTWLTGVMLQYKKVQAGIYTGVDYINNQTNYQWMNNGKMWLGFGIGYELFKVNLGKGKQKNTN